MMTRRLGLLVAVVAGALLAPSAQGVPAAGPGYVAAFQISYDSPPFPDTRYRVTVSFVGDVCGNPFDGTWGFEATRTGGPSTPPPTLAPVTFAAANPINVTDDGWFDANGAEIARIEFFLRFNPGSPPTLTPSWQVTGDIVNVVATPTVVPVTARRIAACPAAQPPPPPPNAVLGTASGKVLVNGRRYTSGRPISYGSKVNVTHGRLTLKTELGTVTVYGAGVPGVFRLVRLREPSDMLGMPLVEGNFKTCGKSKGPVRRLWARGSGSGRFQTMGRHATATVRDGWWLTADLCDATLVRAREGSLLVTDLVTRKKIVVNAPKSYTARRKAR
jgi:hypothetical protein